MKGPILIIATIFLAITAWQKWPLPAYQLAPSQSKMRPILPAELDTIDDVNLHAFFHSHRAGEAGHFHIFFTDKDQTFSHHIIGASIDENGYLIKLFVTAPWVTHDDDLPLPELLHELDHSESTTWISTLLQKHSHDIEELLMFTHNLAKPRFGRYKIMAEKVLFPL